VTSFGVTSFGVTVFGAVLCGGRSERMGRDKAFVEVRGRPMVRVVADTLQMAGCARVGVIGGDRVSLETLGLDVIDDRWPGEGPLGGLVTAFEAAETFAAEVAVVLGCDLPLVTAHTLTGLIRALADDDADVALATSGRDEPLCAAWRVSACRPVLRARLDDGERAVHRALAGLRVRRVPVPVEEMRNVNRPDDLLGL
jgi:molybdopterin-guanine dinucleotide biosynthesis protein A